jgi:hypothetical protein
MQMFLIRLSIRESWTLSLQSKQSDVSEIPLWSGRYYFYYLKGVTKSSVNTDLYFQGTDKMPVSYLLPLDEPIPVAARSRA